MSTYAGPAVLLSIDYEPWFTLGRRFEHLANRDERMALDGGFTRDALAPILEQLGTAKVSFYIVGEVADWYPDLPERILAAGHELGLHCQHHRSLIDTRELAADLAATAGLRQRHNIRGYRAPMVGIREAAYDLLAEYGFLYSSSIYAPAGTFLRRGAIYEIPVSSFRLVQGNPTYTAPLDFARSLFRAGELPYGSSFCIGVAPGMVLRLIERDLDAGRSPVIILHPYELVAPSRWPGRLGSELFRNPLIFPFTWNKSGFVADILRRFPVSTLGAYLDHRIAQEAVTLG